MPFVIKAYVETSNWPIEERSGLPSFALKEAWITMSIISKSKLGSQHILLAEPGFCSEKLKQRLIFYMKKS